jgi:hypothetical protein
MTISYVNANRRDDLRAAALFVIDPERQERGFDAQVAGSADVPDVIRTFDEMLAVFPLESEIGDAIRSADELPSWREVRQKMEPLWKLWPAYSADPNALLNTEQWAALREAVQRCVEKHGLWHEEIDYPVRVVDPAGSARAVESWDDLARLDPVALEGTVEDARGRRIELELNGQPRLRRVGLPSRLA